MEDDQLVLLIKKYDPDMNKSDIDYLVQIDDREAVINTIYAKLMEREDILLNLIDQKTSQHVCIEQQ
jgi:hypothetical protein